jgi:hypothetical protein
MAPVRRLLVGALGLCAVVMSACGPGHPGSALATPSPDPVSKHNPAGSSISIDLAGPPPLVLQDTSPDQLAAQVHLTIGSYDPATRNVAELSIVFLHDGHWVQFVRGERLTCNGIPLPGPGTAFDLQVPAETIGGKQVSCTYTSGAKSATFSFTVPPAPTILSPADGSRISRSRAAPVHFNVGGQNTMFYIIAIGVSSKSWMYPFGDPPSHGAGNAPAQATLDTTTLAAGPGSINLRQSFTLADLRGPGFHGVDGNGEAFQVVSVTWA